HSTGHAREGAVRRGGGDQDHVQLGGLDAGRGQRPAGGAGRDREGRRAGLGDVAPADAGPVHDPLVRGFDQSLKVGVGENPLRRVHSEAGDRRRPARRPVGAKRERVGAHAGLCLHRHDQTFARSACLAVRYRQRSPTFFILSSSSSGRSTSYLSSTAPTSSTRSSESAARSLAKLTSIWTWSGSIPRISLASSCSPLKFSSSDMVSLLSIEVRASKYERGIVTTEPEGVRDRHVDLGPPGAVGDVVQVTLGVLVVEVDGGRDQPPLDGEDAGGRLA